MTTFTRAGLDRSPDPGKHVNYTYGMVLGVDDFVQEFAYLSGRDRELARELGGYGTVGGLRVEYQPGSPGVDRGPRLSVSPGLAVTPSGHVVRVAPTQCAYLTEWLAAHRAEVEDELGRPTEPKPIELAVVLGYTDCATDPVPIPGEPCRSEDDLMAPSRLGDDFELELRLGPGPDQHAERAIRAYAAWLRRVPVVASQGSTLAEFLAAVRAASGFGRPPPEQPCPPIAGFFGADPPPTLKIPRDAMAAYLRAVIRVWVTEFLPCWRWAPTDPAAQPPPLTLATVHFKVRYDSVEDRLLVVNPPDPGQAIDETNRAFLLDLRVLQEWAVAASAPVPPRISVAQTVVGTIVAAGWLDPDGAAPAPPFFTRGGLAATRRAAPEDDVFDLTFDGFDPAGAYLVTGTAVVAPAGAVHTVEVVAPGPGGQLAVRVRRATSAGSTLLQGFQVQITRFEP